MESVNVQRSNSEIPTTFAGVVEDALVLAVWYPVFHYAVIAKLAYRNMEFIAASARALGQSDFGHGLAGKPNATVQCSDSASPEELLALDRGNLQCKSLGGVMSLMISLKRDLIMASSVVC